MEIIQYRFFQKVRDCARVLGYHNKFNIQGIRYDVDPSSVGRTPLGETTALGAIEMINERKFRNLKVLDIGCGVGIIGLTMFKKLFTQGIITEMSLSDINFFNINSLKRVLKINALDQYLDQYIFIFLSDVLSYIPKSKKFDLIVSNPPDFKIDDFSEVNLSGASLGRYSENWYFHRQLYTECHHYLTDNGEIWFLENRDAIPESKVREIVGLNKNIELTEIRPHHEKSFLYWSLVRKVDSLSND